MPKQQFPINKFEGGIVSDPNPRDIGENQFSVLKGFDIDSLGGLKLLGTFSTHATIDAVPGGGTYTYNAGYGLFSFSADRNVAANEAATDYLVATNGDYVTIWDDVADGWNGMNDDAVPSTGIAITGDANVSTSTNDHIWSFYAPDGDLRASDGNFDNYNHIAKILKYIPSKDYGAGENIDFPTDLAEATVGGNWIAQDASVEHGVPTNHLKMINLGSKTKGVIEGNSANDSDSDAAADFLKAESISTTQVTITNANIDHGTLSTANEYYNGMTCSFFKDGESTIYGTVFNYDYGAGGESTFNIWTGPEGKTDLASAFSFSIAKCSIEDGVANVSLPGADTGGLNGANRVVVGMPVSGTGIQANSYIKSVTNDTVFVLGNTYGGGGSDRAASATSSNTTLTFTKMIETWSFQVGQSEGYLWNNDLHEHEKNRGVISGDYGVTLAFEERATNTGSWMPTANTRYKFYHTTTFDASSGDLKQQESAPSLFTMYPTRSAAGTTTHPTVKEMFFCDGGVDISSDASGGADNTTGTAAQSLSINFALIVRLRSDNTADGGGSKNFTIGDSNYDDTDQDAVDAHGTYNFFGGDERVAGGRVYWSSSEDGFNSLNLLMDYDLEKGIRPVGSGSGQSTICGYAPWQSYVYPTASNPVLVGAFTNNASTWFTPPVLETYETINGYNHDAKMDAKWKTCVVANNRIYAGNVKRKATSVFDSESFTENTCVPESGEVSVTHTANKNIKVGMKVSGTGIPEGAFVKAIESGTEFLLSSAATAGNNIITVRLTFYGQGWNLTPKNDPSFSDRIIKSPVGKYDIFPDSAGYVIEGFNSDDGDEIIKLETFADRLLAFKKYKLQIYNIQKGTEFLEQEVLYNGLDGGNQGQSCATEMGIAWMNSKGVHFYDGRQIQSLTDNKIKDLWSSGDAGYANKFWLSNTSDVPLIAYDSNSKKLFCLKTGTSSGSDDETCLVYCFKTQSWTSLVDGTAFASNTNKRFAHYKGELVMDDTVQIKSWSDSPQAGSGSSQHALTTKDFDFGAPGVRKKIYKVYITYQSGDAATNVQVKYGINGDTTPTETFKDGNNFASNELAAADVWQVAELKPSTSIKDCKSFQLAFTSDGAVPAAFEIDDITIIYRTKPIK